MTAAAPTKVSSISRHGPCAPAPGPKKEQRAQGPLSAENEPAGPGLPGGEADQAAADLSVGTVAIVLRMREAIW